MYLINKMKYEITVNTKYLPIIVKVSNINKVKNW